MIIVFVLHCFLLKAQHTSCRVDSIKIQRLACLCKVWGLLKYYHPEIQKGNVDWDTTLIEFIPKILRCTDSSTFNQCLTCLITLPGTIQKIDKPYKFLPKDTACNNFDFNWIHNSGVISKENCTLLICVIEYYKPRKNIYIKEEIDRYYQGDGNKYRYYYRNTYLPDTNHALLALFRYWNVINYFYAYKNLMDKNWDDVLIEFIPKIIESSRKQNFYIIMAELITRINDCHGFFVNYNFDQGLKCYYPIEVRYVENQTIITKVHESISKETGLEVGDIITSIDGTSINERRNEFEKYFGCSNQNSVNREISKNILRTQENGIALSITNQDSIFRTIYIVNQPEYIYDNETDSNTYKISEGIGYVNLANSNRSTLRKAFKEFSRERAIIFDLRNNSWIPLIGIALRLPQKENSNCIFAKYYRRNFKYPGSFKLSYQRIHYHFLSVFNKKYKGKVVFLINENVQSTYEWSLMWLKAAYNITLIGNNTAGSDGIAASYLVLDNFLTYFSCDAIYYPNGNQTQRIGIAPDILITPTIEGIRNRRDEIIDGAIKYIDSH